MITSLRWMEDAACVGLPTEWFFPDRGGAELARQAKAVCAWCSVRRACLDFATATDTRDGIWGGFMLRTPAERSSAALSRAMY